VPQRLGTPNILSSSRLTLRAPNWGAPHRITDQRREAAPQHPAKGKDGSSRANTPHSSIPFGRCSLVASGQAVNLEGEVLAHQHTNCLTPDESLDGKRAAEAVSALAPRAHRHPAARDSKSSPGSSRPKLSVCIYCNFSCSNSASLTTHRVGATVWRLFDWLASWRGGVKCPRCQHENPSQAKPGVRCSRYADLHELSRRAARRREILHAVLAGEGGGGDEGADVKPKKSNRTTPTNPEMRGACLRAARRSVPSAPAAALSSLETTTRC
jgi:hypothetical protein